MVTLVVGLALGVQGAELDDDVQVRPPSGQLGQGEQDALALLLRLGTLAWVANTTRSRGPVAGISASPRRNGSRASPTWPPPPSRPPISENSSTSRPLCSTNRSHPLRNSHAFSVAGTEMPGSPETNTGRGRNPVSTSPTSTSTTGPVQATSTTSGLKRSAARRSARADSTGGSAAEPATAAWICAGDGVMGVRMTASSVSQPEGRSLSRQAAHFR